MHAGHAENLKYYETMGDIGVFHASMHNTLWAHAEVDGRL